MLEIREIPNSDSWKTDTDNPLVNGFRQMMKEFNDIQNEPEVGIFWYDVEDNELFGVVSETASTLKPYFSDMFNANAVTTNKLHYAIWQKNANKGKDDRFKNEYTKVPRGRVFEVENKGFIVCVGRWINDYPKAKNVILDEFNLPKDTEFLIGSYWNLGRGVSNKYF